MISNDDDDISSTTYLPTYIHYRPSKPSIRKSPEKTGAVLLLLMEGRRKKEVEKKPRLSLQDLKSILGRQQKRQELPNVLVVRHLRHKEQVVVKLLAHHLDKDRLLLRKQQQERSLVSCP